MHIVSNICLCDKDIYYCSKQPNINISQSHINSANLLKPFLDTLLSSTDILCLETITRVPYKFIPIFLAFDVKTAADGCSFNLPIKHLIMVCISLCF